MSRAEHLLAGAVSGSPGRVMAFVIEFAAALLAALRGRLRASRSA
jgi:hypothetical protein